MEMVPKTLIPGEQKLGHLLLCLAVLMYCTLAMLVFFFIEEDSYIYFRAAENIANGNGYVFNIGGTPVETGSGPLWQYMVAAGVFLGGNPVLLIKLFGLIFGLGTIVTLYKSASALTNSTWGGLVSIALAGSIPFVWWANSGLELAAYTFLLSTCILIATQSTRPTWLRTLPFALLLFARPEAFLIVPIFIAALWFSQQKAFALRVTFICATSYFSYLAFRYFYFHEVQISAFYAKITAEGIHWNYVWFVLHELRISYLILPAIPAIFLLRRMAHPNHFAMILLLSLIGVYFAGSNYDFKPYYRFYALALPQLLLLFACSIHALSQLEWRTAKVAVAAYAVCATVAAVWIPRVETYSGRSPNVLFIMARLIIEDPSRAFISYREKLLNPQRQVPLDVALEKRSPLMGGQSINENYQAAIGHFLYENYPQGLRFVYDQMGQTAYLAGLDQQFVDLLGLASPPLSLYYFNLNAADNRTKQLYKNIVDPLISLRSDNNRNIDLQSALQYVYDNDPDVVLIHNFVAQNPMTLTYHLSNSEWLRENYVPRYRLATWVTVYERKHHPYPLKATSFPPALAFEQL